MSRPYDDADDLQEREQYLKDQGVDHEEPINSLEQITETSVLQRVINKAAMIDYINRHLPNSASLDTRKSFCYYDSDKDFVLAMTIELSGPGAEDAFKQLDIKYWSKGIV